MEALKSAKAENDLKKKEQRKKLIMAAGAVLALIAGYVIFRNIKK